MSTTAAALPAFIATSPARPSRERRLDLDRAKGVAILIVVFGHIVAGAPPPGAEWWDLLRTAIYAFHMPFFLYLSGTVFGLMGTQRTPLSGMPALAAKRAARLLPPFFLFGLLILFGKLATEHFVHVDNRPDGLLGGLRDLLFTTARSPATSVWYLWVLFVCSIAAPPIWRRIGAPGLVLIGLLLLALDPPSILYADRLARHAVFFAIGIWAAEREALLLPLFTRYLALWWLAFVAALLATVFGPLSGDLSLLVCGLLSIPALHGLMRVAPVTRWQWPLVLGQASMVIYLFNTIAIGVAKAALILAGIGWTAAGFWIHIPVLTAAGVILPMLGKRLVLRHIPVLDRMTS
ncbi:acyltransferase [Roseomonas stagni]|uniref:Acyltransferase n=1 Tax=Falsiroseomonas algicola TaxID=2716930 RepID=A0A6M1LJW8_9PROT|nr:acyltransferase [Falsiroseomonas algicola]NGM20467.1 acyltransferase [Falsiroseomonas algicola]